MAAFKSNYRHLVAVPYGRDLLESLALGVVTSAGVQGIQKSLLGSPASWFDSLGPQVVMQT